MRFCREQHSFYCGVDLHVRTMYLCILDGTGSIVLHRRIRSEPEAFIEAIEPYRDDLVVCAECIFCWYWHADLEGTLVRQGRVHEPSTLGLLRTIPGVGEMLGLTLLYEIHTIERFPSVQDFSSYGRSVKSKHTSDGKTVGAGAARIGNATDFMLERTQAVEMNRFLAN